MISTNLTNFVVLVLAVAASTCHATQYLPCTDKTLTGIINKVTVSGCPTPPCTVIKGNNVSFAIDFTMKSDQMAKTANTSVHGLIDGVLLPYKTAYTDACDKANIKCPLMPSSKNLYEAKLYVKKDYPSLELYVQWELLDQDKKDIFCFKLPVIIKS
ncbi:epididymal secretory protein E1-like [Acanthaster planci]|uniref:Epididymal secretory protein E1-like n=1 Tax=Acanthaster planci TaxID=133434 RepID=A0A8B7YBG5_ACAPL|nr:epididymal secretory protein E1-like [Acanthaster planci]